MMQVSKKIPFDDPQVLMGVRALYLTSNLMIIGVYLYLARVINSKKGTLEILWLAVPIIQTTLGLVPTNLRLDTYRYDHTEIRGTGPDGLSRGA